VRSRDQYEPSWPNAVPVSWRAGGGIPCRPNPAPCCTLLVYETFKMARHGRPQAGRGGGGANGNVKVDLIQLQRFGSHKMNQNRGSTCVFDCVVVVCTHIYYIYIYYNIFLSEY